MISVYCKVISMISFNRKVISVISVNCQLISLNSKAISFNCKVISVISCKSHSARKPCKIQKIVQMDGQHWSS